MKSPNMIISKMYNVDDIEAIFCSNFFYQIIICIKHDKTFNHCLLVTKISNQPSSGVYQHLMRLSLKYKTHAHRKFSQSIFIKSMTSKQKKIAWEHKYTKSTNQFRFEHDRQIIEQKP